MSKIVLSAKMTWFVTKFLSGTYNYFYKSCWVFDNFIILLWMLLNNVNSFFVITQIRYMKSAQPCSGFANQQMFFRAAKSARPWSSPEPFEKKAYFVCLCLTSFAKPAGRPAARPAQCGPAGRPARAPPRGVQRNFDSQKLVLSDPDLIISLQQMRGQI